MEIIKRLNRELVYKGTVINMYRDTVQVQNGHIAEWDFIGHKGAAAVVPVPVQAVLLLPLPDLQKMPDIIPLQILPDITA